MHVRNIVAAMVYLTFWAVPLGMLAGLPIAGAYYAFFPVDFRSTLRVFFGVVLAAEGAAFVLLAWAVLAEGLQSFKRARQRKRGY